MTLQFVRLKQPQINSFKVYIGCW